MDEDLVEALAECICACLCYPCVYGQGGCCRENSTREGPGPDERRPVTTTQPTFTSPTTQPAFTSPTTCISNDRAWNATPSAPLENTHLLCDNKEKDNPPSYEEAMAASAKSVSSNKSYVTETDK